ncbi:unnamed protein product, partial [Nippostrongylus brasiliensis]|uniref:Transposase n=1 Tax=Nippostrongylus brasiliensis TaxID=27835 RepID=A0A0N4YAH8_NIPBR
MQSKPRNYSMEDQFNRHLGARAKTFGVDVVWLRGYRPEKVRSRKDYCPPRTHRVRRYRQRNDTKKSRKPTTTLYPGKAPNDIYDLIMDWSAPPSPSPPSATPAEPPSLEER